MAQQTLTDRSDMLKPLLLLPLSKNSSIGNGQGTLPIVLQFSEDTMDSVLHAAASESNLLHHALPKGVLSYPDVFSGTIGKSSEPHECLDNTNLFKADYTFIQWQVRFRSVLGRTIPLPTDPPTSTCRQEICTPGRALRRFLCPLIILKSPGYTPSKPGKG